MTPEQEQKLDSINDSVMKIQTTMSERCENHAECLERLRVSIEGNGRPGVKERLAALEDRPVGATSKQKATVATTIGGIIAALIAAAWHAITKQ